MTSEEAKPDEPRKPRSFSEAVAGMKMTEQEVQAVEDDTFAEVEATNPKPKAAAESAEQTEKDPDALPDWVTFPPNFRIPPGKDIVFLYFRSKWTDRPEKGDRWCMLWPLSDADEKLAIKRTRGESGRSLSELTKGCIRLIDGKRADWTNNGDPATSYPAERFWDEIGARCRQQLQNIYLKTHALSREEQADFLENCVAIRKATAG